MALSPELDLTDPDLRLPDLTWEEFNQLPNPPGRRWAELINGRLIVNAPSDLHQVVVRNLLVELRNWARKEPGRGEALGDRPVKIHDYRGLEADVAWWPQAQCAPPGEPPSYTGPPGITVEVLSPSTRGTDLVLKRNDYPTVGVPEFWIIDPQEPMAFCHRRSPGSPHDAQYDVAVDTSDLHEPITSPQLPDFSVTLAELLRR